MRNKKLFFALFCVAAALLAAILIILLTQQTGGFRHADTIDFLETGSDATPPIPEEATEAPAPIAVAIEPDSPEAVVYQYLTAWGQQDEAGMQAYVIDADKAEPMHDLEYVASLDILSYRRLDQAEADERFNEDIYANPSDTAMVRTDYTIHYNQAGQAFFLSESSQQTGYLFWLVKETADGDWHIAMQGH